MKGWYVLKVKSGEEFRAKELLEKREDVEKVLALCEKRLVVYSGRKVKFSFFITHTYLDRQDKGEGVK